MLWGSRVLNLSIHLDVAYFVYVAGFTRSLLSAVEGSDLLRWVIGSFCLLSLLCWQLHLGEMFVFLGRDLKVRALEPGCVLTAERRRVLAQLLKSASL